MQRDRADDAPTVTATGHPVRPGGQQENAVCLTCGCNDAHKSMGNNLTYEDLQEVAIANGTTVEETLQTMNATAAGDRARHMDEYQDPSDPGRR